jgi:hypothetical protein
MRAIRSLLLLCHNLPQFIILSYLAINVGFATDSIILPFKFATSSAILSWSLATDFVLIISRTVCCCSAIEADDWAKRRSVLYNLARLALFIGILATLLSFPVGIIATASTNLKGQLAPAYLMARIGYSDVTASTGGVVQPPTQQLPQFMFRSSQRYGWNVPQCQYFSFTVGNVSKTIAIHNGMSSPLGEFEEIGNSQFVNVNYNSSDSVNGLRLWYLISDGLAGGCTGALDTLYIPGCSSAGEWCNVRVTTTPTAFAPDPWQQLTIVWNITMMYQFCPVFD